MEEVEEMEVVGSEKIEINDKIHGESGFVEGDDGDDAEDSDEESEDEGDDDDADEIEVKKLEAILGENPYDYASHVAIISKYQAMGDLERLRAARERMSSKYPLSPELWLAWIRDEMKLALSEEERTAVEALCERAVKDYLCKVFRLFINPNKNLL